MFNHSGTHSCRSFAKQTSFAILTLVAFVGSGLMGQLKADDIEVLSTAGTNNVAIAGQYAFAAAGVQGIVIVDLSGPKIAGVVAPPVNTGTVDDVSIDGDLLFTLDASGTGGLSVFSIANPMQPTLVSGPVIVDVSPFAGVSAANGSVVVSGGTGLLSRRNYQLDGTLVGAVSTIDLGVGQPDVLVGEDGEAAFVSTDFAGAVDGQPFGITVLNIGGPTLSIIDQFGIDGAGFTPGFEFPANFPIESAQSGDKLYVAFGNGVAIFDVSNPSAVQVLATIPIPGANPVNIDVAGDMLYVVSNSPDPVLISIDVSGLSPPISPLTPIPIQTTSLPSGSRPLGVAATNTSVVIADEDLGILVESLLLLGDVNQDGMVDFLDIPSFIGVVTAGGTQAEADIDQNGTVDFLDIAPFIGILAGSNL